MKHHGFPQPADNSPIPSPSNSIYSDNTRSMILDINKANLKIFENMNTRLNDIYDILNNMLLRLQDMENKIDTGRDETLTASIELEKAIHKVNNNILTEMQDNKKDKPSTPRTLTRISSIKK